MPGALIGALLLVGAVAILGREKSRLATGGENPLQRALAFLRRELDDLEVDDPAPPEPTTPRPPPDTGFRRHPEDRGVRQLDREELERQLVRAANRWDVPATLLAATARVESNFQSGVHGSSGEFGMMQLMKPVAQELLRRDGFPDYPLDRVHQDPSLSIHLAAQLMAELRTQLGLRAQGDLADQWANVIQGYNLGAPAFKRGVRAPEYLSRVADFMDGGSLPERTR